MSGQEKLEFEALQWSHKLPGADLELRPMHGNRRARSLLEQICPSFALHRPRETQRGGGTVASTISIARKLIFSNRNFLDQTLSPFVST